MQSLKAIVEKIFPDEIITSELNIKLRDTWKTAFGIRKSFYMKPIQMVETDKKLYFDKRATMRYQSLISTLVSPIWISLVLLLLQFIFHPNFPIWFYGVNIIMSIVIGIINLLINIYTILNIFVIDKSWIDTRDKEKDAEIISGHIPRGNHSYVLSSFLSKEQKATLSYLDRYSSKSLLNINFALRIKPL